MAMQTISLPAIRVAQEPIEINLDMATLPVERPHDLKENQLGLLALDLSEIDPKVEPVVEIGRWMELDRGNAGFSPNTVRYIWGEEGLSLHGLLAVAQNYVQWRRPNR